MVLVYNLRNADAKTRVKFCFCVAALSVKFCCYTSPILEAFSQMETEKEKGYQ